MLDSRNLMPCRYRIDTEQSLVVSTAWGRVTFADMKAHQDELASNPLFKPEFYQFVDATAVKELDVSLDEARKLAERKMFSSSSRRAFLGSGLSMSAAVLRLAEAYFRVVEKRESISVFHDREAALKWLGLVKLPQQELETPDLETTKRECVND